MYRVMFVCMTYGDGDGSVLCPLTSSTNDAAARMASIQAVSDLYGAASAEAAAEAAVSVNERASGRRSVMGRGCVIVPRAMSNDRPEGLLAWQWSLYTDNHRDRRNLLLHALSVPFFQVGTLLLVTAPLTSLAWGLSGLGAMVAVMITQGRGHRLERSPPVPFNGPLDIPARIFVEQWVTFPRFVLSGGFARMWREAGEAAAQSPLP